MSDIVYPVGKVSPGYCMWCGVHAGENNSTREKKWCSSKCGAAAAYWRKKNNARSPRKTHCDECGEELVYGPNDKVKRFCDYNCQRHYRWKNVPGERERHMARSLEGKRKKAPLNYAEGPFWTCRNCGDTLDSIRARFCKKIECRTKARSYHSPGSKICSMESCKRRAETRGLCSSHYSVEWARLNRDRHLANVRKRQALKSGATKGEIFTRLEIMERDGWVCHLCGGEIDRNAKARSREYGTVDHIIPLSKGGNHTLDNVAAAHGSCNSSKGNRV